MSQTQPTLRVLISGAGIGGPVAAYWLAKAGHKVTVVERAPILRKEGQTVDVRKEGLRVLEWMNIRKQVDERTTKEVGVRLVDDLGKVWAELPQDGDDSLTSEVEIVRGELAMLFYEVSKSDVEYLFGTTISDFMDSDIGINVTLKNAASGEQRQQMFDVIIASEGLYSSTRARAFKENISAPIRSMDRFNAAFSLPANANDSQWASGAIYFGRRLYIARPDGFGRVRVNLMWHDEGAESRNMAHPKTPIATQKEYIRSRFKDLHSPAMSRFFDGLAHSDDLYLAEIGQTITPSWSRGRVVLVGDTAYCPSAMTGMGTTTAIVGAYVLAAELVRNPTDHTKAFSAYETQMRPWVEKIQGLAPRRSIGETKWGVAILYGVFYFASTLKKLGVFRIFSLVSKLFPTRYPKLPLPPPSTFDTNKA